jgi:hypothetical protein
MTTVFRLHRRPRPMANTPASSDTDDFRPTESSLQAVMLVAALILGVVAVLVALATLLMAFVAVTLAIKAARGGTELRIHGKG